MGKKEGLKAPILGEKEVLGVLGDMSSMPWGETTARCDSPIPWPLSKLRIWIEAEQSRTDDPAELLDLEMAEMSMVMAEVEIKEIENGKKGMRGDKGDPEIAVLSGINIGRYLARYEMRSQRRVVSRGKSALLASSKGGLATKKLNAEQEDIALRCIDDRRKGKISKTDACGLAASDLKSNHGIDVSKDTLLRLLRKDD